MVAGLAHESRNALQTIQACLELLPLELENQPRALELVDDMQKAQDRLHSLFEDVRGYAAPLKLKLERVNLADIWRNAWKHLELRRDGRDICFEETGSLEGTVDPLRLEQVFQNIFENSLAACRDPV